MQGQRNTLQHGEDLNETAASTTLEEQLARYQQHWSAVDFDREDLGQLRIRYGRRGPRGWWVLIPAVLCLLAAGAVPFTSPLGGALNALIVATLLGAAVALVLAWRSCVRLRLNRSGLKSAPFPPLTGPAARVPLDQLRRFRVEKSGEKGTRQYAVHCLTHDGDEFPLIRKIRIRDDAYLVSMLLIDRVKAIR